MEKISLEFELEDLINTKVLFEIEGKVCEGMICEIRKDKYVRVLIDDENKWFKVGDFKVVDILN